MQRRSATPNSSIPTADRTTSPAGATGVQVGPSGMAGQHWCAVSPSTSLPYFYLIIYKVVNNNNIGWLVLGMW